MDLHQLRAVLSAGFASLFLILLPVALLVSRPAAAGIWLPLLSIHRNSHPDLVCDGNPIFLTFAPGGNISINGREAPQNEALKIVAEIMDRRVERAVFLVGDPQISVQQFAQFFDRLKGATPDLHVILVSGEVRRALDADAKAALLPPNSKSMTGEEPITLCDFVLPPQEFAR